MTVKWGWTGGVIANCVGVLAPQGREACIKTVRCFLYFVNSNVTRQRLINSLGGQFVHLRVIAGDIKMEHLCASMDAGICASGNNRR